MSVEKGQERQDKISEVPALEARQVFVTRKGRTILEDINLQVRKGSFGAFVGPNGAGKTTLLRAFLGLISTDRGSIRVLGLPPAEARARHCMGYLPQRMTFDAGFPISVLDVVMMGRTACLGLMRFPQRRDRLLAEENLKRVGMLPHRYRRIGELSGGEQQRVFLARALCGHTKMLLLDEPTNGLDQAASANFYLLLKQLQKRHKMTIVVVSHDLETVAKYAEQMFCIQKKMYVCGSPEEVLNSVQLRKAYVTPRQEMPPGIPGAPLGVGG